MFMGAAIQYALFALRKFAAKPFLDHVIHALT